MRPKALFSSCQAPRTSVRPGSSRKIKARINRALMADGCLVDQVSCRRFGRGFFGSGFIGLFLLAATVTATAVGNFTVLGLGRLAASCGAGSFKGLGFFVGGDGVAFQFDDQGIDAGFVVLRMALQPFKTFVDLSLREAGLFDDVGEVAILLDILS